MSGRDIGARGRVLRRWLHFARVLAQVHMLPQYRTSPSMRYPSTRHRLACAIPVPDTALRNDGG
eukprot:3389478-Rhodomonas_salina.1